MCSETTPKFRGTHWEGHRDQLSADLSSFNRLLNKWRQQILGEVGDVSDVNAFGSFGWHFLQDSSELCSAIARKGRPAASSIAALLRKQWLMCHLGHGGLQTWDQKNGCRICPQSWPHGKPNVKRWTLVLQTICDHGKRQQDATQQSVMGSSASFRLMPLVQKQPDLNRLFSILQSQIPFTKSVKQC